MVLLLVSISFTALASDKKTDTNTSKATETSDNNVGEILVSINKSLDELYSSFKDTKVSEDVKISVGGGQKSDSVGGSFNISF